MILQDKKMNTYERFVSEFKGLNRLPVISEGELMECMNMEFDLYPAMTVRKEVQSILTNLHSDDADVCSGMLATEEGIYYVFCGELRLFRENGGWVTVMSDLSPREKSIVKFWDKIFVFPDKKYYDTTTGETGDMGEGEFPQDGSVPDIDYAIVHNNRIWGVKGSYIYASANGWAMGSESPAGIQGWVPGYDGMGYPNDLGACWFEVASSGDFTGISSWDDRIIALKKDYHYEITGSVPSNFELSTVSRCGTISNNTICEVNGRLYYLSSVGVMSYGGGYEVNIGRKLNIDWSRIAIIAAYSTKTPLCGAGGDGEKYYLTCALNDDENERHTYVYDTNLDMWTEWNGESLGFFFSYLNGDLYAADFIGNINKLSHARNGSDISLGWSFTFSDYDGSVFRQTRPAVLILKLKGTPGSLVKVEMTDRDGADFKIIKEITLSDGVIRDVKCPITRGGEHIFRVSGDKNVIVFGYYLKVQDGGATNG